MSAALTGRTVVTQSMCCTSHMCSLGLLNAVIRLPVGSDLQHNNNAWPSSFISAHVLESRNTFCALAPKITSSFADWRDTTSSPNLLLDAICRVCLLSLLWWGEDLFWWGLDLVLAGRGVCAPPPPTRWMWPTFIAGIETHCYSNQLAHTARRGAALPSTTGFHLLHNLQYSTVCFICSSYFIFQSYLVQLSP